MFDIINYLNNKLCNYINDGDLVICTHKLIFDEVNVKNNMIQFS